VTDLFSRRIARAEHLRDQAAEILGFYIAILRFQRDLSGGDFQSLARDFPAFLDLSASGPPELAAASEDLRGVDATTLLRDWWERDLPREPVRRFFPKFFLQPVAAALPQVRLARSGPRCPHCSGPPQIGLLEPAGEGAKLALICARCLTHWPHPRVACTQCLQTDPHQLAYHVADGIPQVRVSVCEVCKGYLKLVDRTVNGHAMPLVDDLATLALDIWAIERGYARSEPNLAGL